MVLISFVEIFFGSSKKNGLFTLQDLSIVIGMSHGPKTFSFEKRIIKTDLGS